MYLPCKAYIYDKVPSFFFPVKLLALENYFTHTKKRARLSLALFVTLYDRIVRIIKLVEFHETDFP